MRAFQIKRGDLLPKLRTTLTNRFGVAVSLTGALAVRLHLSRAGSTVVLIDRPAAIVNAAAGIVEYTWLGGDTDDAGRFEAEFEVEWIDGKETFPNADEEPNIPVHINEAIA